jgi:gluconolactonase
MFFPSFGPANAKLQNAWTMKYGERSTQIQFQVALADAAGYFFEVLMLRYSVLLLSLLIPGLCVGDEPVVAPGTQPVLLQEHGAGEGPAWHPELGLLTSGEGNINRRDKVGKSSVYRKDAGSNGLMFDRQGRLVICEAAQRRVTRLELDGRLTVLADQFEGKHFNQPNDLTLDSKNRIYFSDPCYGDRGQMELQDAAGRKIEGVYRIDLNGHVTRIITHEVDRPNGLVVTPDDKYLFVADNNNNTGGGARKLWRFDLQADGTVDAATQKLIYDWKTTRGPDGMKLDAAGRLFVAAGLNQPNPPHETATPATAGIYVFSPDGKLLQFIPIPRDETTNCAFGGDDLKTLFVTAGGSLWSIKVNEPGKLLFSR